MPLLLHQAVIFLQWVKWLLTIGLGEQRYVIVNMDETAVSGCKEMERGWVTPPDVRRAMRLSSPAARQLYRFSSVNLLGTICNDDNLQPKLPQVLLVKQKGGARSLAGTIASCRQCRQPVEFWHKTSGWPDSRIMRHWLTRLRSVVHSAKPDHWIVLLMDCAPYHTNRQTIQHCRRLGIILVFVPARLTWLLQPCDLSVFGPFKNSLRLALQQHRINAPTGRVSADQFMGTVGEVVNRSISAVSWRQSFARVGLDDTQGQISEELSDILADAEIMPRLPTVGEFAELIGKTNITDSLRSVHASVVGFQLSFQHKEPYQNPPFAAVVPLDVTPPAIHRPRSWTRPVGDDFETALQRCSVSRIGLDTRHHAERSAARNWIVPSPVDDGDE